MAGSGALYGAAILWDLGFDTIYAHQDREDDALVGVRSTARLFGEHTRPFLAACYAATLAVLALAGWAVGLSAAFYARAGAAGGAAGLAGAAARHRRSGALPAPVPRQPGGRAGGRAGDPARPAVSDPSRLHPRPYASRPRPPLVPEIALHLATEITPIWQATEDWLRARGVEPPFWAFAWPGGQALARHVLDHPGAVAGRRVLDFAAGGGIAAIAARAPVRPSSRRPRSIALAAAAIALNAAANGVAGRRAGRATSSARRAAGT